MRRNTTRAILAAAAAICWAGGARADNLIVNGGFESNGGAGSNVFANWNVVTQASSGGSWYAQTGTTGSVNNSLAVSAPTGGSFAAMTDSAAPGAQALLQTFTVPAGASAVILSFEYYLLIPSSQDYVIPSPQTLDYTGDGNEQARVDVLTAGAGAFDIGATDLFNALQTSPGDPNQFGAYQLATIDLTGVLTAGQTYQLRFAETDNLGELLFGIDDVQISTTTPEPGGIALMMTAMLPVFVTAMRRRKQ